MFLAFPFAAHSGAKFEPPDGRVIHGLGQYVAYLYTDQENWQYVNEYQNAVGEVPTIYSAYTYLDPFLDSVDTTDLLDIITNHSYPYIMLVGLSVFDYTILTTGNTNIPVQTILNGGWDYRIIDIAGRIKALNSPVFLRPIYEFGTGNSGIHSDPDVGPTEFKNIWMHIYNIFQQENVTNVAWVWNTVNPHQFNYMNWYPGDNYVDWFGINYFTNNQMNNGDGFLNNAAQHNKPVIICESNPIESGGTTNSSNWNNWFVPYFQKISGFPHIKAFVYVSDPWDRGLFSSWPDSRITSNTLIRNNYAQEMTNSVYIHMDEYLANPGIISVPSPNNFSATPMNGEVLLSWANPTFPTFQGVQINRKRGAFPQDPNDGLVIYTGSDDSYADTNIINDTTYYYAIFAFDSVPNYSYPQLASATPQGPTGIRDTRANTGAKSFTLMNFPNPFNSATQITWSLPASALVNLEVFTITGQKVSTLLIDQLMKSGMHEIAWEPRGIPSGIYLARLTLEGIDASNKLNGNGSADLLPGEVHQRVLKIFYLK